MTDKDSIRFESKFIPEPNTGCWLWTDALTDKGYGKFWLIHRQYFSHVVSWERIYGRTPDGLELDHKCRMPACVNPQHLEPVTHRENILRGLRNIISINARKISCAQGHQFTSENTFINKHGHRQCRTCKRARDKLRYYKSPRLRNRKR
mgnify:CR=1 FL=1